MCKKILFLALLLVFLLSAVVVPSSAQPRVVGVNVGDWFKFGTIDINWSSNDPNATFPPSGWEWLEERNATEWVLFSVVDVSGTNVTFQSTEHFESETERIQISYIDVDTGAGNISFGAIAANLNANDTLYTAPPYSSFTINETVTRTYPSGVRETNLFNMTDESSWTINETQYYYYYTMNFYWDKATGVLVEQYFEAIYQTGEYLTSWSSLASLTESNVWVVPEFPAWTLVLILFVVFTFAVVAYKRRLVKKPIN